MRKSEKKEKTSNAKIFVRILPSTDFHYDSIKIEINRQVLYVRCLQDLNKGVKIKRPNYWYFYTDGVFWNSCQSEVYEAVTRGLYDEVFEGTPAVIVSYGQTGTGKSFTTSGLRYPFQKRGLVLRILSQLFEEKEARRDVTKICLGMTYLEFNGQFIRDLITNKQISEVKDVVEHKIPNEKWAWTQIFKAESKKSVSETAPYPGSNRGHTVLSFCIHTESLIDSNPVIKHSKVNIVDMGGIDSIGNKSCEWRQKSDIGNSNSAKSLMEQLFLYFVGNPWRRETQQCPYKTNRLLLYLHEALNDKCLLRFIAHIYGNKENIPITLSTLRFGEKIRLMRPTKLERIYETNQELEVRNMQRNYMLLKNEFELNHLFKDSPPDINISQERLQEIKRAAEGYLFGHVDDLTLLGLGQAQLTLKTFRELYQKLISEKDQLVKEAVEAAKGLLQSEMAGERNGLLNGAAGANQKISRKKSRQESQASFGVSNKSSDSAQTLAKTSSVTQQVGTTDRKGISIGPAKKVSSNFEGNVTKAFKKLKSKQLDTIVLKGMKSGTTRDFGAISSRYQNTDDSRHSLIEELPPRQTAWQIFLNEKIELVSELTQKLDIAAENVRVNERNYLKTLAELTRLKQDVLECRAVLRNCQHIRDIYGIEGPEEESSIPEENDSNLMEMTAQKEEAVNEAIEFCHVALINLRDAVEERSALKRILENEFQNFCNDYYKTSYPSDMDIKSKLEVIEPESDACDVDLRNQTHMELYIELQEQLFKETPESAKKVKKPWVSLF